MLLIQLSNGHIKPISLSAGNSRDDDDDYGVGDD